MSSAQEEAWGQEWRAWWKIPQRKITVGKKYRRLERNTRQRLECCKKTIELYDEPKQDEADGYNGAAKFRSEGQNTKSAEETDGTAQDQLDERELQWAEITMLAFLPFHTPLRHQALRSRALCSRAADTQEYMDCSRKAGEERQNWVGIYGLLLGPLKEKIREV